MAKSNIYSVPALKRLPVYLRELRNLRAVGKLRATSPVLAKSLRIDAISVRKDLEMIGAVGSPGVGYKVEELIDSIESFLGWKNVSEAFLIGPGNLGRALMGYKGFTDYGLKIIAAFDRGPVEPDTMIYDIPVFDFADIERLTQRLQIKMAILCVPDDAAQETAEKLVEAGIVAIWNFTAVSLQLPESIILQKVHLAGDFAVLSVKLSQKLRDQNQPEVLAE